MKISDLVYEIRTVARHEEDPALKDLFHRCANTLTILGNMAKIADFTVASQKNLQIYTETLDFHLNQLVKDGLMDSLDRYPYENDSLNPTLDPQPVKDSKTE